MANEVANPGFFGTLSSYASSAWNTVSTTAVKVGSTVYEYGKLAASKGYEAVQKVVELVKPFFSSVYNFVRSNPLPVVGCLAAGAALYFAATQCAGRFFGNPQPTNP